MTELNNVRLAEISKEITKMEEAESVIKTSSSKIHGLLMSYERVPDDIKKLKETLKIPRFCPYCGGDVDFFRDKVSCTGLPSVALLCGNCGKLYAIISKHRR